MGSWYQYAVQIAINFMIKISIMYTLVLATNIYSTIYVIQRNQELLTVAKFYNINGSHTEGGKSFMKKV